VTLDLDGVLGLGAGWRQATGAGDEGLAQLRQLRCTGLIQRGHGHGWRFYRPCSATRPRAINLAVAHRREPLPAGDLGGQAQSSQRSWSWLLMHGLGRQRRPIALGWPKGLFHSALAVLMNGAPRQCDQRAGGPLLDGLRPARAPENHPGSTRGCFKAVLAPKQGGNRCRSWANRSCLIGPFPSAGLTA